MKLTKFQHACFVVELNKQAIVIDPGEFTKDFIIPDNVSSVVVTHQHSDHVDAGKLDDIVRRYPEANVFSTVDAGLSVPYSVAEPGETLTTGNFRLQFGGGQHAIIDRSIPRVHNISVLINELVFYPGDSFVELSAPVNTLLLPVAAPWMKISDALDYIRSTRPRQIIPTHDAILSEAGKAVVDRLVGNLCAELDITYSRLASGESIKIT